MAKRFNSNKAFRRSKNVRKGSGPLHYKWQPKPFEKNKQGRKRYERIQEDRDKSPNPIGGKCGEIIYVECSAYLTPEEPLNTIICDNPKVCGLEYFGMTPTPFVQVGIGLYNGSGYYYVDGEVTYVYNVLCDGNHDAYVECDYVE